jgi:phosphohistidine phosphatase SixA
MKEPVMNSFKQLQALAAFLAIVLVTPANASEADSTVAALKQGNLVMVLRHMATDDAQADIYPFRFDDMKAQRQLSDAGREAARKIGAALKALGIPLGEIYTSKLNRAVETGKLISGKDVQTREELTDSGAGSSSAMANPAAKNAKIRSAIYVLINLGNKAGPNNILVTHKTNIADAFGSQFSDVKEGEAIIFRPVSSGQPNFLGRMLPQQWELATRQ